MGMVRSDSFAGAPELARGEKLYLFTLSRSPQQMQRHLCDHALLAVPHRARAANRIKLRNSNLTIFAQDIASQTPGADFGLIILSYLADRIFLATEY